MDGPRWANPRKLRDGWPALHTVSDAYPPMQLIRGAAGDTNSGSPMGGALPSARERRRAAFAEVPVGGTAAHFARAGRARWDDEQGCGFAVGRERMRLQWPPERFAHRGDDTDLAAAIRGAAQRFAVAEGLSGAMVQIESFPAAARTNLGSAEHLLLPARAEPTDMNSRSGSSSRVRGRIPPASRLGDR